MSIKFRSILDSSGIRYFLEDLNLSSSYARIVMLDREISVSEQDIALLYSELEEFLKILTSENKPVIDKLKIKLAELKDIRNSLSRVAGGVTPDDIEFFEIKALAMLNEDIKVLLAKLGINSVQLPSLSNVEAILDPDSNRITSFYIYDSYSSRLAELRTKLKKLFDSNTFDNNSINLEKENNKNCCNSELTLEIETLEEGIRKDLAKKIAPSIPSLELSLKLLAKTDILQSKASQMYRHGLIIPKISKSGTLYKGLFNPEVAGILKAERKEFQRIDIDFDSPLLITGANMGGKSLTLKTLALVQYLFQFGFGVPASEAAIVPVNEVFLSIGDEQNYKLGLSSFAAEMKRINESIVALRNRKRERREVLILVDEPARTTNPLEGTALATALIAIFVEQKALSVLTTHYNIDSVDCRRLRVRGFEDGKMNYALIPDIGGDVPREALRIAHSLGIDEEWLNRAREILKED